MSNLTTPSGVNNCYWNIKGTCTKPEVNHCRINPAQQHALKRMDEMSIKINDKEIKYCGYSNCFREAVKMRGFIPVCDFHLHNPQKWGKDGMTFTGSRFIQKDEWTEKRKALCEEFWDNCAQEELYCENGLKVPCDMILEAEKLKGDKMREIRVIVANREDENYILPLIANLCAKYTEDYEISIIANGKKGFCQVVGCSERLSKIG